MNTKTATPKPGTRINVVVYTMDGERTKPATVVRATRSMMPMPDGYFPVKYADGSLILAHVEHVRGAA